MRRFILLGIAISCVMLAGCIPFPLTRKDIDTAAKQFNPPPDGKASVYVIRNGIYVGREGKEYIRVDGKDVGYVKGGEFLLFYVTPAEHILSAKIGRKNVPGQKFEAQAGTNYFFTTGLLWDRWHLPAYLLPIDGEQNGRKAVVDSKFSLSNPDEIWRGYTGTNVYIQIFSASMYLYDECKQGHLPGITSSDHGTFTTTFGEVSIFGKSPADEARLPELKFPFSWTLNFTLNGDTVFTNNYTAIRLTNNAPWHLERAWRTGPGGKTVKEWPVEK